MSQRSHSFGEECYLSLGSNLGDRWSNLKQGIIHLSSSREIFLQSISSVYETDPVEILRARHFYNLVIKARTGASPEKLLKICLDVESRIGRVRRKRNESRILDIDILFYNEAIIREDHLEIPHPRMHLRRFVLVPLHEIAPDFIHPGFKKSIGVLLQECPDQSSVKRCEGLDNLSLHDPL